MNKCASPTPTPTSLGRPTKFAAVAVAVVDSAHQIARTMGAVKSSQQTARLIRRRR